MSTSQLPPTTISYLDSTWCQHFKLTSEKYKKTIMELKKRRACTILISDTDYEYCQKGMK